ncbi:MAG: DUF2147 domain-containing protein [Rhizobiaceae bacterium]|nr:DUF2147 domain-containing protein [Rhizobiaceae bacterium]
MLKSAIVGAALITFSTVSAVGEPILGLWKTQAGENAKISKCGGSFCIVLKTGNYAGTRIGKLSGSNGQYDGTITDPADDKTYVGSAKVAGTSLKLKGCVMKFLCKTQKWKKL